MNPVEYERMRALEDWYWWFVSRRAAAMALLADHLPAGGDGGCTGAAAGGAGDPPPKARIVLDAGCGTGAMLEALALLPGTAAVGLDFAPAALAFCASRAAAGQSPLLVRGDLQSLPFAHNTFRAVVALDVIEHVPDDRAAAHEIARVLRPGGILVASVPAYRFLWGRHDVALHHFRRYVRGEMNRLLAEAGLELVKSTYLVTFLFPAAVAQRIASRYHPGTRADAAPPAVPGWLNRVLIGVQQLELALARRVSLPYGLTIAVVGRKPR